MTATRSFHLADVLTITTGRLVSPRGVEAIYDVLNFMTGDNLFTHQLPRGMDECQAPLLAQHPDLAAVEIPASFDAAGDVEAAVHAWVAEQVERFGEFREVAPLPAEAHTHINPLDELAMNHPHVKVIALTVPDQDGSR